MTYKIDYQSGGTETLPSIPGKTSIDLAAGVINSTSTSLTFTGRGVPNYGEIQQENFLRLLENFASKSAPQYPTIGQIWFDTAIGGIKVYGMDRGWHRISGGAQPSTTPPTGAAIGDLWFNTANGTLMVWDGSAWKPVSLGASASNTAPANPQTGQFWYNTTNNTVNVWNGSEWVPVGSGGGVESGTTPPASAQVGSLWFHTNEQILYVKVNPSTSPADIPLYFTSWAQVWPSITRFASYVEYNELATRINRVIGSPTVFGALSDVADNQYGWGQTDLVPTFTSINAPSAFDNSKWILLESRLRKALRHTTADETTVPSIGFIMDGRGPSTTATSYTPAVTWNAGWDGMGIMSLASQYTALQNATAALETNRFNLNVASMTIANVRSDSTLGTTWGSNRSLDLNFNFPSHNAARAFFNAGSSARFTISIPTGTGVGFEWFRLVDTNNLNSSGLVIDYKGSRIGFAGTYGANGTTAIGFFDLDTSFKTIASYTRGGAYGAGSLLVTASYNSTTAVMTIRLAFNEGFAAGQLINKATVATDVRVSAPIVSTTPYLDSPVIVAPNVTSSGTFLTATAGT